MRRAWGNVMYDLAVLCHESENGGNNERRYSEHVRTLFYQHLLQNYGMINIRQFIIGFAVLIFGLGFYILFRDQTYITHQLSIESIQLPHHAGGVVWDGLPSFVHVFSFSMITASLIKAYKFRYFIVCAIWLIINCLFEFSQKYKVLAIGITPSWFESIPFLENTKNFFINGTFDVMDIFSIFAGTVTAFCLMTITSQRRERV